MDCGCSRKCLGYPRHALCLARARYCTTPHRNFDGLASLPASGSWAPGSGRATGVWVQAAWVAGGPHQCGSWVVPWLHASLCLVLVQVQCSGSPSRSRDGCISPVLILTCGSYLGCFLLKTVGEGDTQRRKRGDGEGRKERREERASVYLGYLGSLPCPCHMLCCVVLVLCRCCQP